MTMKGDDVTTYAATREQIHAREDALMTQTEAAAVLEPGMTRLFGQCDLAATGLVSGWSAPEEAHVWSDGPEAVLQVLTEVPRSRVRLTFEGEPFLAPGVERQAMTLFVNGYRVGFWRLAEPRTYTLSVTLEPEQVLTRGETALLSCVWHLPGSARPADLGQGEDTRELGFCFRSIAVAEIGGGRI
jgi:hypothetical protein